MPDQAQGLINVARADAQTTENAAAKSDWGMSTSQQNSINQDQATSDRMSSPNHRLPVLKTHPAAITARGQ